MLASLTKAVLGAECLGDDFTKQEHSSHGDDDGNIFRHEVVQEQGQRFIHPSIGKLSWFGE